MSLKVIGAGFGRTGTLSLKTALEELGFGPCHHMTEVFANPWQVPYLEVATEGRSVDWHMVLADYQSTTDWPMCSFYEQLMQAYPDAKVILSVRDPEKWYESVTSTIYQNSSRARSLLLPIVALFNPTVRRILPTVRLVKTLVWQNTFHDRFEDKDYAINVFNQHNEEVKQRVPADKLLVFNVKEGWEPLCAFLGVDVPDKPFPRLNDRENFAGNRMRRQQLQSAMVVAGTGIITIAALAIGLLMRRRKSSGR